METTCLDASRRAPTAASRETAAGGTTLWEMTTDPVPPSMFAGYHYTVNPKKPGYDGLWGTHPEFGLMRGTENIIGTVVRSPRFEVVRCLHFLNTTRIMLWVVSFLLKGPFGPRRGVSRRWRRHGTAPPRRHRRDRTRVYGPLPVNTMLRAGVRAAAELHGAQLHQ